jgi:hypothetical protein
MRTVPESILEIGSLEVQKIRLIFKDKEFYQHVAVDEMLVFLCLNVGLSPKISERKETEEPKKYIPLPLQGLKGLPPRPSNPINSSRRPT